MVEVQEFQQTGPVQVLFHARDLVAVERDCGVAVTGWSMIPRRCSAALNAPSPDELPPFVLATPRKCTSISRGWVRV
jgi:hypothetical protein